MQGIKKPLLSGADNRCKFGSAIIMPKKTPRVKGWDGGL